MVFDYSACHSIDYVWAQSTQLPVVIGIGGISAPWRSSGLPSCKARGIHTAVILRADASANAMSAG